MTVFALVDESVVTHRVRAWTGRVVRFTSAPLHAPNTATCLSYLDAALCEDFLQVQACDPHLRCQRTAARITHAGNGTTREPRSVDRLSHRYLAVTCHPLRAVPVIPVCYFVAQTEWR